MRTRSVVQLIFGLCLFMAPLASIADQSCQLLFDLEYSKPVERLSIKDQGCNGVCSWFAAVSLIEESVFKERNEIVNLSPVALLADQLVSRAISHLKNKDKSFDEEAIHEAYRVYGLYSEDIKYVRESDWVLSEKYSDGGVEKFSAGVDKILKSQNSDEDKIKSIKTLSIEFFGYKKPAAQEDYDPKLTIVKVRVDPNLPWFKQAATYKSIFEPLISIPARTNINNLMDILNKRLSENKPVLVKMYWDDKGENRKDGKLRLLRLFMQNYETSDHSVLFYKKDWRGRYYFINSWGKEVGKDGHYTTTASYLKKAISGLEFAVTDKEIQARREAWHP